jgi:hypothetical protein
MTSHLPRELLELQAEHDRIKAGFDRLLLDFHAFRARLAALEAERSTAPRPVPSAMVLS